MPGRVETVKVEHEDGYAVINKSDFDPKVHKEIKEGSKAVAKAEKKAEKAASKKVEDAEAEVEANKANHVYSDEEIKAMPWAEMRKAAAYVSKDPIQSKEDAIAALVAHREKNKG